MKFSIITAFPNAFSYLAESIPKRAQEKGAIEIELVDLRKFTDDKWGKIDDKPYGGGAGMLLMVEPVYKAIKEIKDVRSKTQDKSTEMQSSFEVWLMSAGGQTWNQQMAETYVSEASLVQHIILIAGHYEGVDNRIVENLIDREISIGNYVLTGGELATMVIIDSITRLLPGVISKEESYINETKFFGDYKVKEHPHYTRPEIFISDEGEEWRVPKVLLSGNHGKIEEWRKAKSKRIDGT